MQERGGGRFGAGGRLVLVEAVAQTQRVGETDNGGSRASVAATAGCRSADAVWSAPPGALDNPTTNARRRSFVRQPPSAASVWGGVGRAPPSTGKRNSDRTW